MQITTSAEQMFLATTRIATVNNDGGQGSGTGFFFGKMLGGGEIAPFIVTNRHVVDGKVSGSITLLHQTNGQPDLGKSTRIDISDWENAWFYHPDPTVDIAVAPLANIIQAFRSLHGTDPCLKCFDYAYCPTEDQVLQLDAIEPVTFVGYPNGIWDTKNFLPIARRGTTATPPSVDFCGEPKLLIDASVFGGSSGSPVFVRKNGMFNDRSGMPVIGNVFHLLGVISAVCTRDDLNRVIFTPVPVENQAFAKHTEMLDLGVVIKSRVIPQAIDAFLASRSVA